MKQPESDRALDQRINRAVKMAVKRGIPVSERALVQRINRALAKDGEKLKKSRSGRAATAVGEYLIVDMQGSFIVGHNIDLLELGRELKVVAPYEQLVRP